MIRDLDSAFRSVAPRRIICPVESILAVALVGNGELLAALSATCGQHATAVLRCHSLTETVLVIAATVVGLKCSFHIFVLLFIV